MSVDTLSHEQARFFRSQGYFRLPEVFSKEETSALRELVLKAAKREQDQENRQNIGNTTLKLYGLYQRDPALMDGVVKHPKLVGALSSLLGPNVVFVTNRHNHATVNDVQGEPAEGLHRDILQPTRGLLTAAVYLQPSNIENGATRKENGGGTWMSQHAEYDGLEEQALSVPMPEGGILLFNGLAFHGVGANSSGGSRISMTLGFRAADELDFNPDNDRQILVTGEHLYRGNDLP